MSDREKTNFRSAVERLEIFGGLPRTLQTAASRLAADMTEITGRDETAAILEAITEEKR